MSYTNICIQSNAFEVKDLQEVKRVIEAMDFVVYVVNEKYLQFYSSGEGSWFDEDTEVVLSKKPINDNNLVGVVSECTEFDLDDLLKQNNLTEDDVIIQPITEYLQDELIEGTGMVITTAGFESRCGGDSEPFGDVMLVTKNSIDFLAMARWVEQKAEELKVTI